MDPDGHHKVADMAGFPRLRGAFQKRMGPDARLDAFYLGNWLTDVSQVIDPKALERFAAVEPDIHKAIDEKIETLLNGVYVVENSLFKPIISFFDPQKEIAKLHPRLRDLVSGVIHNVLRSSGNKPSLFYQLAQSGLLLKGYFKFVHPEESQKPPRMDLNAYVAVFDAMFTQYYPHEHFDRPEKRPSTPPISSGQLPEYDYRPFSGPGASLPGAPDLYTYLREDIQVIAGLLTELDLTWASPFLALPKNASSIGDDSIAFNIGLAKLGHALHAVEDFFAHSNFIEHVATVVGDDMLPQFYEYRYSSRFWKRLKRYSHLSMAQDWRLLASEDYVVTGYFDAADTINSLGHFIWDGLLGIADLEARDFTRDVAFFHHLETHPYHVYETKVESEASKYLHALLELLELKPKDLNNIKENTLVKDVKELLTEAPFSGDIIKVYKAFDDPYADPVALEKIVGRMTLFQNIAALKNNNNEQAIARVIAASFNFIKLLRGAFAYGQYIGTLYQAHKEFQEFYIAPMLWIRKKIAAIATEKVIKTIAESGLYFAKDFILYTGTAERVGCHSLMAKDHAVHEERNYEKMQDCAAAVHYAVVDAMMRWDDDGFANRPSNEQWINWLDLLEFFLCNPKVDVVCNTKKAFAIDVVHTLTSDEKKMKYRELLKSLSEQYLSKYQPTTILPTGTPYDMQTVFKQQITDRLKSGELKKWVVENTYKSVAPIVFPPLQIIRVIMPFIPYETTVCTFPTGSNKWYIPIVKQGWDVIKTANPHTWVYHDNRTAAEQALKASDELRRELERLYRPPAS